MMCWKCPAPVPSGRRCWRFMRLRLPPIPNNPQEVATMDDAKKAILKDIFWQMNEHILPHRKQRPKKSSPKRTTVTAISWKRQRRSHAPICISSVSSQDRRRKWQINSDFNADQRQAALRNLLAEENRSMWCCGSLWHLHRGRTQSLPLLCRRLAMWAVSRIGRWYGFDSSCGMVRLFCFVGVRMSAAISTAALSRNLQAASNGVQWFKDRGQWHGRQL